MSVARQTVLLLCLGSLLSAVAAEWPQYRGPNGDGVAQEPILTTWPASGLPELWRKPVTNGFSSFAIAVGRAYTLETRAVGEESLETCVAWDAVSGSELWTTNLGAAVYDYGSGEGDGPRSTPSVEGGRVFVLSANLKLTCLSVTNGHVLWSRDFLQEFGAENIPWQNAASPLLEGGLVFLNCNAPDGTLAALRQSDGAIVWRTNTDVLTHATPVAASIHGVRQVIFFAQSGLVSVKAATGDVLWTYPFPFNQTSAGASPVVWEDVVYCSAAFSSGAGAVQITRDGDTFTATELWRRPAQLRNYWSTPVCLGGYLYGLFESQSGSHTKTLRCVDLRTGDTLWSEPGFASGGLLLVDGRLLIQTEGGELVLAEAAPFSYLELARSQVLTGKSWNVPAVSNGRIYARSTTEAVCLNAAVVQPSAGLVQTLESRVGGQLCLRVASADGALIEANRLDRIQILMTTNVAIGLESWSPVTNNPILTNGVIEVELLPVLGQRYFVACEQP